MICCISQLASRLIFNIRPLLTAVMSLDSIEAHAAYNVGVRVQVSSELHVVSSEVTGSVQYTWGEREGKRESKGEGSKREGRW